MQHNFLKPYYSLYQRFGCSGELYVNDVLVYSFFEDQTQEGGSTGTVPINNVILERGKYKVVGKMHPRYGKNAIKRAIGMDTKSIGGMNPFNGQAPIIPAHRRR